MPARGRKEDEAKPFSVVWSEGRGGHLSNLKCRKFHLNIRKKPSHCEDSQTWNRLSKGILSSPSLKTPKTGLEGSCEQPALPDPGLGRRVD